MLIDDDGKLLLMQKEANSKPAMVNEGKRYIIHFLRWGMLLFRIVIVHDEVEDDYNETSHSMASGYSYNASLHEDEDFDLYDTYDLQGLNPEQLAFCDSMDINLRGHNKH